MKNIFHGTCSQKGCNKGIYAEGLCYEHYMEHIDTLQKQLNGQKLDTTQPKHPIFIILGDTMSTWHSAIAVVLLALLWLFVLVSIILFDVYCYRYVAIEFWQILIPSLLVAVLAYALFSFVMYFFNSVRWTSILFIIIVAIAVVLVLLNDPVTLFEIYKDKLEELARYIMDLIATI